MTPTQKTFPLLERKTSAQDVIGLPMAGAHIYVESCLTKEHYFFNFILKNHVYATCFHHIWSTMASS